MAPTARYTSTIFLYQAVKKAINKMDKKKAIKPTQEWFSRVNNVVTMPISVFIAKHTRITPTELTIFSIFIGVLSAFLLGVSGYIAQLWPGFFLNEYQLRLIGGIFAYVFGVLDGVDGKVARLTNKSTHTGKWWDIVAGHTTISLLFLGLAIGLRSYLALLISFIGCISYLIAYLQIAVFKVDFNQYMQKQKLELIKNRKGWTYLYGMSLIFILIPLAALFDYPMVPLYFYGLLAPLFYLAVLFFQYKTVKKIR